MKFIELNKSLKTKIESVYKIVGDDVFLIRQTIINLKKHLIKAFEEFNFVKLDAEKMKTDEIEANLMTLPINNDYRLVVIVNPNNEICKYINNFDFSDSSTVVLAIGADKITVGQIIDCSKLDRKDLNNYILNYLAKLNLSIHEQALDYLVEACSSDTAKINNELNKIVSYSLGENINVIDLDLVTNLISYTNEYVIYMLTNAIDNKDYTKYQTIINQMNKSQSASEIFSYLGKYFRRMQYISIDKKDDELTKILNIKPYAVKMARQSISKNGIKYYINLYQKYVNLDYKIKSGEISAKNALQELIF